MTQKTSSFLDAKYGWDYGESGWNTGMDENLLKFSFLFDKNIEGVVSSLPTTVTNGTAYFLSTDKRIYFGVANTWYSTPTPKWFIVTIRTTGVTYQFNGTDLVSVPSNSDLASQLSAVQVTVSSLGTAAFKNIEYFATPAQLATAVAQSQSYTDSQVLNKASKGANSDITSLSGLTTPLTITQGGTGGATPIAARSSLGLGTAATKNSRAIDAEIIPAASAEDGVAVGYTTVGTGQGTGNEYNYYQYVVSSDTASQKVGQNGSLGSKVNGMKVYHKFGGPTTEGGRHAMYGVLLQGYGGGGATSSTNPDRNYVGVQGQVLTMSGDGGTAGAPLGAYFGMSSYAGITGTTGTYIANLTGMEINTYIEAGVGPTAGIRCSFHSGIQIASYIGERGYTLDTCFSGGMLGGSLYGWKYGMSFHGLNGAPAFSSDSTAFKVFPSATTSGTIDTVIDVVGVNTAALIRSNGCTLTEAGINFNRASAFLNMGSSAASAVTQTFRTSGAGSVYDAKFTYSGGSSTAGQGVVQLEANGLISPLIRPTTDNNISLGLSSSRWSVVYAGTGTINTSDANEKTEVQAFTKDELNAAKALAKEIGTFKWLASIQVKGEDARTHIGLTVQRAKEVMEENNLDPMAYGFICYDEWEATDAVTSENEEGEVEVIQPATEAGSRYGFRMDQLNLFIAAGFEARLSALEAL